VVCLGGTKSVVMAHLNPLFCQEFSVFFVVV